MKKENLIKLGLSEELAVKVEAAFNETVKLYVPKAKLDEEIKEKNTLTETLKERDKQLEKLKSTTGDAENLKKTIEDLQKANKEKDDTHAAEIKTLKLNSAVDTALNGAKAKNLKAVKALLDLEKAELAEDGTVKGLAEQIKKLTESEDSKFMFDSAPNNKPKIKGAVPGESGNEEPDTNVDITKMSYEELAAYMENNPDAKI